MECSVGSGRLCGKWNASLWDSCFSDLWDGSCRCLWELFEGSEGLEEFEELEELEVL